MSILQTTDDLFFKKADFDHIWAENLVNDTLHKCDDGELFLEYSLSEMIAFDDGRIQSASHNTACGYGLRSVVGDKTGYAHASELTKAALHRSTKSIDLVRNGYDGVMGEAPGFRNDTLYGSDDPLELMPFEEKVTLLGSIDSYVRAKDPRVVQVSASMALNWQAVQIIRAGGIRFADIRPLVRLNVSVILEENGRRESGYTGSGGRSEYHSFFTQAHWKAEADEALRVADINLQSVPTPAGEMTVVLGPGWPGILLHEAVGHGLEGDFNRKGSSAFSGKVGERVAAKGVTVIDDGTLQGRRGSLTIDDEGTASQCTTLIDDGILKGYMQDRQNARLMNTQPTGNGRRESYAHVPMPRMTNTYMLNGKHTHEEIIASTKDGIYAPQFGGGQVDIVNGQFVFSCTEAYRIENGKITAPLKGATLIGSGPDVMQKISMIGNDQCLDPGIGTCGKNGQGVPVGVGQPTLRLDGITVGGTDA
ncbi:MAG: metalloprotease TldD [Pseudomonadota bacterium]